MAPELARFQLGIGPHLGLNARQQQVQLLYRAS